MNKKSLELLKAMFAENSQLQLPMGFAENIIEIRQWVDSELAK